MRYDDLKTGENYHSVRDMLWVGVEDPAYWRYKRRHTVLGLWHSIKQGLWEEHIYRCSKGEYFEEEPSEYEPGAYEDEELEIDEDFDESVPF